MKIESKIYKNMNINLHNEEVMFDEKGFAEVSEELGNKIVEGFKGVIWEEGKEEKPVVKAIEETNPDVAALKEENTKLKIKLRDKDQEIALAKQNEQVWRDAYKKLEDSIKIGSPVIPNIELNDKKEKEEEKESFKVPEGYEDLYKEMKSKQVNALRKWIKESFQKTEEDLKDLKGKEELIKFVFDNCIEK